MSAGNGSNDDRARDSAPDVPTDTTQDLGDGKDPTPAGGDGASSEQSGYRRDDYWRQAQQDLPADAESEPAHGQDFETPEERARAGDDDVPGRGDEGAGDDSERTDDTPEHVPPHAK